MHKNKKVKTGISLLLSFFLAVALFLVTSAVLIKTGFLPGIGWRNYLTGSSYGSHVSEEVERKLAELLEEYGLPKEAAGELVRQETLHMVYSRWLEECWEEKEKNAGRQEELEENLESQITSYLTEQQVNITEPLEEDIQILAKEAGRICRRYLYPGWLLKMQNLQEKYQGILTGAIIAGILTAALCSLLLWKLHRYKHRTLRFMIYAMEAAALWNGLLLIILRRKQWIVQSGIASAAYRELIGGLIDAGIRNGMLMLAAELWILIMLAVWMKRKKRSAS